MSINGLGYTPPTQASQDAGASAGVGKQEAKPEGDTIRVQVEFGSVHVQFGYQSQSLVSWLE